MASKLRNIKLYLSDIINSINKINEYIGNYNYYDFQADSRTIDAVIRNFEVIGEASKQIPNNFKIVQIHIDWIALTDFRNVIIHNYFGINTDIIWDIIKNELPKLYKEITSLYQSLPEEI